MFYEKPTGSRYCILETSASSYEQKKSSLSQEVVRRLETTSSETDISVRLDIIETFCEKMKRSGYSQRQVSDIVTAGIVGHVRKVRQRQHAHRRGEETETQRRLKKLTGKTSWYKTQKKKTQHKPDKKRQGRHKGDIRQTETENKTPDAVLFIDRTDNGGLAQALRQKENEINKLGRKKIKLV